MPASIESLPSESSDQRSTDMLLEKAEFKDISFEPKSRTRKDRFSLLHAVFLISYGIAWMVLVRPQRLPKPCGLNLISSPAREAVKYERVVFENEVDGVNPFLGEPSPEVDAAWSSILKCTELDPRSKSHFHQMLMSSQIGMLPFRKLIWTQPAGNL
ncbi:hypothetical protein MMC11_006269 [Xylographa trunciseda]|nr:hypothetical protein [Xylographa trunciseda]